MDGFGWRGVDGWRGAICGWRVLTDFLDSAGTKIAMSATNVVGKVSGKPRITFTERGGAGRPSVFKTKAALSAFISLFQYIFCQLSDNPSRGQRRTKGQRGQRRRGRRLQLQKQKGAKKAALAGSANTTVKRKARTSVTFHRPRTLRLERNPKYQRRAVTHAPRMDEFRVISAPLNTESAMKKIEENNTLVFLVDIRANKRQIADAVKKLWDVQAAKINTLIRPDGKKKAYVRLTSDHDALDVANKVRVNGMFPSATCAKNLFSDWFHLIVCLVFSSLTLSRIAFCMAYISS